MRDDKDAKDISIPPFQEGNSDSNTFSSSCPSFLFVLSFEGASRSPRVRSPLIGASSLLLPSAASRGLLLLSSPWSLDAGEKRGPARITQQPITHANVPNGRGKRRQGQTAEARAPASAFACGRRRLLPLALAFLVPSRSPLKSAHTRLYCCYGFCCLSLSRSLVSSSGVSLLPNYIFTFFVRLLHGSQVVGGSPCLAICTKGPIHALPSSLSLFSLLVHC